MPSPHSMGRSFQYPAHPAKLFAAGVLCLLLHACSTTPAGDGRASAKPESPAVELAGKALSDYDRALTFMAEEPQRANEILQKLVVRHSGNEEIWVNLAISHFKLRQHSKADLALAQALKLNPSLAAAYNLRGLLALENYKFDEAEDAFLKALQLNEQFALAHYNLGLLYDVYRQDIEKALNHYEAYLERVPEDAETAAWTQQLRQSLNKR